MTGLHDDLARLSLVELSAMIRKRKVSCSELAGAYLDRIRRYDGRDGINAFITVDEEKALAHAQRLDDLLTRKKYLGPLHGIPLALKDNIETKGMCTTAGTTILRDFVPASDANVAARLVSAGAVIIGKNNMHELARGITNNNPHYGAVRNPYDRMRIPGGSSGGSAAAVAAGLCAAAVGSDTGGSVRIPAALCGLVGFRPGVGRVGRGGTVPLSFTLDAIGPLTRTVADSAMLLRAITGPDPEDPDARAGRPPEYEALLGSSIKGVKLGVPRRFFYEDNDPEVEASMEKVLAALEGLGAVLVDVDIKNLDLAAHALSAIASVEAVFCVETYLKGRLDPASSLEDYLPRLGPDVREKFESALGPTTARKGSGPLSAYGYLVALRRERQAVLESFRGVLEGVEALITPTTPLAAVRIGEDRETTLRGRKVDTFGTFVRSTSCISLTGLPCLTVQAGWTKGGLPLGVQLVGRKGGEARILGIAHAYEEAAPWHRVPELG